MSQKGLSGTGRVITIGLVLAAVGGYLFLWQPRQEGTSAARTGAEAPRFVNALCTNRGERSVATEGGGQYVFRASARAAERCSDGEIWKVSEDGAKVTDPASFYFDARGGFLDICQALFLRSGCERFASLSCEAKNYCE